MRKEKNTGRFDKGREWFDKAMEIIPCGTQTGAKRPDAYGELKDSVPFFVDRAKGARFWDLDGNEFIAVLGLTKDRPVLAFYDAQGKHRAALSILGDEPKLILYDEQGQDRASVGVDVTTTKTGVETTYPESSIRLYGPDGFTLWSVP